MLAFLIDTIFQASHHAISFSHTTYLDERQLFLLKLTDVLVGEFVLSVVLIS